MLGVIFFIKEKEKELCTVQNFYQMENMTDFGET